MSDDHANELSMTTPTARKPVWIFAVISLIGIAVLSLPRRSPERVEPDPALEAGAIVQSFVRQLTATSPTDYVPDPTTPKRSHPLLRDPFLPPPSDEQPASGETPATPPKAPPPDPFDVEGIFIDGASRFAVIGGRRVAEGDSLHGYWVAEITPHSVLLWRKDEFKRLPGSSS